MTVSKKTAVDPQEAVEANALANIVQSGGLIGPAGDVKVAASDSELIANANTVVTQEAWQLPDGHPNLLGKYVTLSDDKAGIVTNVGTGPTGLGMVELDGTMQHVANVVEVREPTAKERKAAGAVQS